MAGVIYKFTKLAKDRYAAINPETDAVVGYVSGGSNNWNAERLDFTSINNRFPTKQAAADHTFYR